MTSEDFRQIALGLSGAVERAHMGHADFQVGGKVFATLDYPREGWGMVKLSPEEQRMFVQTEPAVFMPVKGAWGRRGGTSVLLEAAGEAAVYDALRAAWRRVAPKGLAGRPRFKSDATHR
jgi:hypothetical protein